MFASLICASLMFANDKPAGAERAGAADRAPGAGHISLDGNWTVVSLEKNGQPMPAAKNRTVHIKGNVVTFHEEKATGADKDQLRSMRLHFGHHGHLRVTEADAGGKFSDAGTSEPATETTARSGDQQGNKAGVYVLTHDYLAVCVHDTAAPGTNPGTAANPVAAAGTTGHPEHRSYCTVVLKREGGSQPGNNEK